jgi:BirA family transcriptional regulator, biotin operon repressor / biotin---[acetyl-CoA-carboxylase] ligase
LNSDRLAQALKTAPCSLGVMRPFSAIRPRFYPQIFDCLDSTNAAAWELVNQGAPTGTAVIARQQRAGRGQRGQRWQSPLGGLYLSLVLQPEVPASSAPQLALAGAWGIAASLNNLGLPVQLKWPNDLVADGRKLAGVLTETRVNRGQVVAAVMGVGLNISNPVPPTGLTLQQLLRSQPIPPLEGDLSLDQPEAIAAVVLYGLTQGYLFWQTHGTEALTAAYRSQLTNLGPPRGNTELRGVTARGALWAVAAPAQRAIPARRELQPGEITLGYNA